MTIDEICFTPARDLVKKIVARDLSVYEVMDAHLARIERFNPAVNAICTLLPEQARQQARDADQALSRGASPGPLCGLPVAIKDLTLTKDIRTTQGSPIYKDFVPDRDALFVERFKAAGAIVIGKTNTPEFGAGSHTFNTLFGVTRNPHDLSRSAGGSSGGAGAALASGMLPIADGSDLGGSVRNPASFNGVVGLRPSPGRIPKVPTEQAWDTLSVYGPMARDVSDVALLLSVMAGADVRDPICISESPDQFAGSLSAPTSGIRIAYSPDLGQFPVDAAVTSVIEKALPVFTALGCEVEHACPDFDGAWDAFHVLRGHGFAGSARVNLDEHRALLKDTVIWNIESGLKLSARDVALAQIYRSGLFARMHDFFQRYDFLVLPTVQVAPFPAEWDWVHRINDVEMQTYVDWMQSCALITMTECPAISIPCGFTDSGLPVGLQIVGRFRKELDVLQLAYAFEQTGHVSMKPPRETPL